MKLPLIGLGTSGYGGYFEKKSEHFENIKFTNLLMLGYDQGARVVDTAESYAAGATEQIIGSLSPSIRNNFFIMSKFSPENSSFDKMKVALHQSLRRLKRDYVDVYMPHWPSTDVNIFEVMDGLMRLVDEGKIKNIGVSNYSLKQYKDANFYTNGAVKFVQAEYGPYERSVEEELLPKVIENKGILVAYSPFRHGELFNKTGKHYTVLQEIASELDCTISQIVLLWIIRSRSVIAIPKSQDINRIKENLKVLQIKIPAESIEKLSKIFTNENYLVDTNEIIMEQDGDRPIYYSLDEAIENKFNLYPGPKEIADEIKKNQGTLFKPIKLKKCKKTNKFIICEGRLKYWAWILLYGKSKKIPSTIIG